jgi:hypothetical protein
MGGGHNKNQGYDNGGQEMRVRGNAYQVLEKYLQLARDAGAAGDRVAAENFLQHADHYYRVLSAQSEGQRPRMGGRELSVADVNVQNVSQGLSAALYSGPNPHGMSDPGMQGENVGNQGGPGGGQQGGGQQGGVQQSGGQHGGGYQGGGHQQGQRQGGQPHGHHQGARQQSDGPVNHNAQAAGGNAAPTNGNSYGNYAERTAPQSSYKQPAEPVRNASQPVSEDQPDYPEDLLPGAAPAAAPAPVDDAQDGVQRTLRAPRARLRGPGRRGPRQGDDAQGEVRDPRQGERGTNEPSE